MRLGKFLVIWLFLFFALPSFALELELSPKAINIRNGESFTVKVLASGLTDKVAGYQFQISFNPQLLQVKDVKPGAVFPSEKEGFLGPKISDGLLSYGVYTLGAPAPLSPEGILAEITFVPKGDTGDKKTEIRLENVTVGSSDEEPRSLPVDIENDKVEVSFGGSEIGTSAGSGGCAISVRPSFSYFTNLVLFMFILLILRVKYRLRTRNSNDS